MGIVKQVFRNHLDEVTGALVLKGSTRETVKRHASSLIPLLSSNEHSSQSLSEDEKEAINIPVAPSIKRKAAVKSREATKSLIDQNLA